jgi:hypothetical protein
VPFGGPEVPPHGMQVSPGSGLTSVGNQGGPFSPSSQDYTLKNHNDTSLSYQVTNTAQWLSIANAVGTIPPGGTATVTVSINSCAIALGDGQYTDSVSFTNTTDHDGDTTRAVTLKIGVATLQHQWNMDTNPGWTTQSQWAWGQPTGGGGQYGYPDPTSGHTGQKVYGYNLSGDYASNIPEYHLTSTAINCSNLTEVSLRFWRWLGVEQPSYDHAYVRVSNNGSTWTTIWENDAEVTDSSWVYQEFDLSAIANNKPAVYLRWTMGATDSSWVFCGWNIDDVEIWGRAPSPASYPVGDLNCDGVLNAFDIDPFVLVLTSGAPYQAYYAAFPDCNHLLADCNCDGAVNAFDIDPFVNLLTGG